MQVPGFWWDTSWSWILFINGFGIGPTPSHSFIITEDNNPIITEVGDNVITE